MKRVIAFFILTLATVWLSAQPADKNYIRGRKMTGASVNSFVDNIVYFDGLGREYLTVKKAVSENEVKERLATLQEYDERGRKALVWLPLTANVDYETPAALKERSALYNDSHPYTQLLYEPSLQARVNRTYGHGEAWYANEKYSGTEYGANTATGETAAKIYRVDANGKPVEHGLAA